MLSKNAFGNIQNRYTAIVQKCFTLNSLATLARMACLFPACALLVLSSFVPALSPQVHAADRLVFSEYAAGLTISKASYEGSTVQHLGFGGRAYIMPTILASSARAASILYSKSMEMSKTLEWILLRSKCGSIV